MRRCTICPVGKVWLTVFPCPSDSLWRAGHLQEDFSRQVYGVSSDTLVWLASGLSEQFVKKQCGLAGSCFGGRMALHLCLSRDCMGSCNDGTRLKLPIGYHEKQVTGTYSCKRMPVRWTMEVFFNILDISVYNVFVVWIEVNPGLKQGKFFKGRLFLEELGKTMVAALIQRRQHLPQTPSSAGLVRDIQGPEARSMAARDRRSKRKRCNLCAPRDVKTSIMYHKCSAYICKAHATTTTYCSTCA
ncbi:unnamed protein product [Oncorhynchus mykiss]|uniref:PiggyBac transposable element-derived protein domain-containing protein n=1 Tax=Oncorhynchus mykiss TaxID=8022 RepID=A0A060WSK8_ONCMY|nr:unnamed protein product [Oncorhynchus mykiss]